MEKSKKLTKNTAAVAIFQVERDRRSSPAIFGVLPMKTLGILVGKLLR